MSDEYSAKAPEPPARKSTPDEVFDVLVAGTMEQLYTICVRKINADHPGPVLGVVTERQIEHSLRNLPVSVRSSMIQKCFKHFNARKEP